MARGSGVRLRVALVGGPMYDPLYQAIPAFERETRHRGRGRGAAPAPRAERVRQARVRVRRLRSRPAVHAHEIRAVAGRMALAARRPAPAPDDVADLLPRAAELSRVGRRLLQVPRNLDVRLLHYRRDLFEDAVGARRVRGAIRTAAAGAGNVDRARRRRGVLHAARAVRLSCSPGGARGSSARSTSCWSAPEGICSTWRFVRRSTRRPACGPRTISPSCTIAGR